MEVCDGVKLWNNVKSAKSQPDQSAAAASTEPSVTHESLDEILQCAFSKGLKHLAEVLSYTTGFRSDDLYIVGLLLRVWNQFHSDFIK